MQRRALLALGIGAIAAASGSLFLHSKNSTDRLTTSSIRNNVAASPPVPDRDIAEAATSTPGPTAPSVLIELDAITKARLEPWFAEYRATIKASEPVTEYDFFMFDAVVVQNVQSGAITEFRFGLNDRHSYKVAVDYATKYDGGEMIRGHLPDHPPKSKASIHVSDDGTVIAGSVQAFGTALLIILPVPNSPYHVVFLKSGTMPAD